MANKELSDKYRAYFFNKKELEKCIGFDINYSELNNDEPYYLKVYKARITLSISDCAGILANNDPNSISNIEYHQFYSLIEDAIRNKVFPLEHAEYDINGNMIDGYINKNLIGIWAKNKKLDWPLPLDDDIEETTQDHSNLSQRIKILEEELEEQKKINDDFVEVPYYKSPEDFLKSLKDTPKTLISNDISEKLQQENEELKQQLDLANKEIEELKKQTPILLGKYRDDDPLLLAIKTRFDIWNNYNPNDAHYKPLDATRITKRLKKEYPCMSDRLATSIELVACPVKRK